MSMTDAVAAASFRALGVSDAAADALEARGYTHPLPVQEMVLSDVLSGRDVLCKSPTGSGKTLAFMLPLLERLDANSAPRPAALVLAPTRELASQIVEEARTIAHARALRIAAVYGGVGITKQAREAARAHVLVATPGRLEDLLQRGAFKLDRVEILVLDEADRMLDMGFKPAIDRIVAKTPRGRQTLFFSATLDGAAGDAARNFTSDGRHHEVAGPEREEADVEHRFVATAGSAKLDTLLGELDRAEGLAIVFVRTKHGADRLVRKLASNQVDAVAMHGGKSQNQRERALGRFERGDVPVLVATDVAARGIDVDDVRHVINFDAPADREAYVHRVGRTGRAGRSGAAATFVTPEQEADVASIVREIGLHDEYAQAGLAAGRPSRSQRPKAPGGGGGGPRNSQRRRRSRSDRKNQNRQKRGGNAA